MNKDRIDTTHLHAALAALGWSPRNLADITAIDPRTVRRWASGNAPIPPRIMEWINHSVRLLVSERPFHSPYSHSDTAADKDAMNERRHINRC